MKIESRTNEEADASYNEEVSGNFLAFLLLFILNKDNADSGHNIRAVHMPRIFVIYQILMSS